MSDIRFDLSYMNTVLGDCGKIESQVSSGLSGMQKVAQKIEGELSLFNAEGAKALNRIRSDIYEIRDLIAELDRKISNAEARTQKEINPPQKPFIPANATADQRNEVISTYNRVLSRTEEKNSEIRASNERIKEYVRKCNDAKRQLEDEVAALHQIESSIQSEIEHTVSRFHEFIGQTGSINNQAARINSAMREFNLAFKETYEDAERLYTMTPRGIDGFSYNDKQFVIKNTHSHISASGSVSFNFSSNQTAISERDESEIPKTKVTEFLIRDKDEEAFFDKLEGIGKIKMPSANLHRLGGKKFIGKMNSYGYTLVTQPDGSTIDTNGLLHWEKSDD